ncbi:MAG: hypothetical protein J5684_03215, partial [Eubacterium sp.]|nr:hypothetical protein [Eubacterium sp.]
NDIEKANRKTVDPDLLQNLHDKCNLSMDYIFGYETEFPNYENKNACIYSGLSIDSIELLHSFALAKNEYIPPLETLLSEEEIKKRDNKISKKNEAEWILTILEVLLNTVNENNDSYLCSNILFDLYMIAVVRTANLQGIRAGMVSEDDDNFQIMNKSENLYIDSITMIDTFGASHKLEIDKIHKQIWKNRLYNDIEKFISLIQDKYVKEDVSVNRIPDHKLFDFG